MLYFFEITNTKQLLGNYWIPRILVKKAFDISQVRSTLNTQFFASLSGASFYNAETQENSKNAKVEDYDRAMTGVEGASSCPPCCESRWSRGRRTSWWGWRGEDGGSWLPFSFGRKWGKNACSGGEGPKRLTVLMMEMSMAVLTIRMA